MAGWSFWHKLSDPTWEELHLHSPGEGPDRYLLLLPITWNA